jgi:Motility quorum-sensing regulator, toxin of MqsA
MDASALGYDSGGMKDVVLALTLQDFYKTMASDLIPGLMQDVYRPRDEGLHLYVKVQVVGGGRAVVVSFKER